MNLTGHQEILPLRCKCAVSSCPWLGCLSKVIKHVDDNHPGIRVDISAVGNNFTLEFEHPVLLLTQCDKTSPNNDLYWLRLHKNGDIQFVLMQYQGEIGQKVKKKYLIREYSVSPVNNPKLSVTAEVVFTEPDEENIQSDQFVESQGTDVTVLNSNKFVIQIKGVPPMSAETLTEYLECFICLQITSGPIRMCSTGHSICNICVGKINRRCPKCQRKIHYSQRNYAMEALTEKALINGIIVSCENETLEDIPCWYKESGCSFTSRNGVDTHLKECEYQLTKCIHEIVEDYRCTWKGSYNAFLRHIRSTHYHCIRDNNCDTNLLRFGTNYNYYFFENDCFLARIDRSVETIYGITQISDSIYFGHLTTKSKSNFNYEIRISNLTTGSHKNFKGRCEPFEPRLQPFEEIIDGDYSEWSMFVKISRDN